MIVEDIYKKVLNVVEAEITLPDDWLLGSKTEDATDARYILCEQLHLFGLSSMQIQCVTGLKKSTVNKMLAGVSERILRRKVTGLWWLQIDYILQGTKGG